MVTLKFPKTLADYQFYAAHKLKIQFENTGQAYTKKQHLGTNVGT